MSSRRRARVALIAAAVVAALAIVAPSSAQLLEDPRTTTTTSSTSTTTTSSTTTSSTTTTAPSSDPAPSLLDPDGPDSTTTTTTTTAPPSSQDEPPIDGGEETTPAPEGAESPDGEPDGDPAASPRRVPAEAQAIIDSVRRSPASSAQALHDGVQELVALGLSPEEAVRVGYGRFPVGGPARYSHDWLYPRYGPGFRFHLGTDVFAPYGTPLRAPVDGTVTAGTGSLGGLYVKIFMDDGTYFYFAHMSGLAEGFVDGMTVQTGDIVGFVGDSGNAKGTPPHLHIGIYPQGGAAVDPKPVLDQMLADAEAALPAIVEQVRANRPVAPAAGETRLARTPRALLATDALRPLVDANAVAGLDTTVLYETVGNPTSGGLAVADAEASRLAAGIDWAAWEAREATRTAVVERTTELLLVALGPLAPPTS